MPSIKPSIGRVVLVRLPGVNMGSTPDQQPLPALICFVSSDTLINVGGFFPDGTSFAVCNIQLIPSDQPLPTSITESYAHWMDYQITAAAKAEGVTQSESIGTVNVVVEPPQSEVAAQPTPVVTDTPQQLAEKG